MGGESENFSAKNTVVDGVLYVGATARGSERIKEFQYGHSNHKAGNVLRNKLGYGAKDIAIKVIPCRGKSDTFQTEKFLHERAQKKFGTKHPYENATHKRTNKTIEQSKFELSLWSVGHQLSRMPIEEHKAYVEFLLRDLKESYNERVVREYCL